ncbi:hypothetical protein [Streptomyces sp. HNM0574]|uniref:2'-5' RNA ligase family protein n=1 Tax=Streptomyces sp. HNM0574 TaxID=2714954 RepID=UPI00146EA727|nr:hypothetical protein [Streptomyces sp. HNM0574]NLU67751.1 hypothetical protein [Streptomyces sp. HNM0574]
MTDARTVNAFFSLQIPTALEDGMIPLQQQHRTLEPQQREEIHITLAFLAGADAPKLADAAALTSGRTWPLPRISFTGEVRHGSWTRDPAYHYDENTVQQGEQIRLGVEPVPELLGIYSELTGNLGITEDGYWPHVTLGVARENFPAAALRDLPVPTGGGPARSLDLRQAGGDFRVLVRRGLG